MTERHESGLSDWDEALGQALQGLEGEDSPVLFYEERADLRIESAAGLPLRSVVSFWRGLAARGGGGGGPVTFQADPAPADAARLARLASEPAPRFPRSPDREGRQAQPPGPLPETELVAWISEAAERLARTHPRADFVGRAVAFEQRVIMARAGRLPIRDLRRGARLRLECRLPGAAAAAVAELLLPRKGGAEGPCPISVVEELARRAESLRDARDAPQGRIPIVLAPGVGGILVHEIVGHPLEADRVLGSESWLGQFEERVASSGLRVIDDPRRGRAAWRFDDEGEASKPTPLIQDGRVAGWLHDTRTARAAGRQPTGHGRCSSYRDPVQPRMGCTFVAPGSHDPAELLHGIHEGIYVRRMETGRADPRTGRAVFRVTDADRILDGKIDAPLRPHMLFVEGQRALAAADRVADDLTFDSCIGSCHRDGRPLSVSVGAPTMWIGLADVFARENPTRDQR